MNLFILTTISIKEKSLIDLKKGWAMQNIEFERKITYDNYIEFLDEWNDLKYAYESEDNCYFTSLDTAKDYALSNVGDINDGGSYNYIAITKVPLNKAYAMTDIRELYVFKYVENKDIYEEVSIDLNEETKLISRKNNYHSQI